MCSRLLSKMRFILPLAIAVVLSGCSSPNQETTSGTIDLVSTVDVFGANAIFALSYGTSEGLSSMSAQSVQLKKRLMKRLSDGTIKSIHLFTRSGKPIDINVVAVKDFGDYVAVNFYESAQLDRTVLIRMADGKVVDYSAYDLIRAQRKGDYLFAWDYQSTAQSKLYKIDLRDFSVMPFTSHDYDMGNRFSKFLIDANHNVQVFDGVDEFLVLLADGSAPFKQAFDDGGWCPGTYRYGLGTLYGDDGHIYRLCMGSLGVDGHLRYDYFFRRTWLTAAGVQYSDGPTVLAIDCGGTVSSPACAETPVFANHSYQVQDNNRYVLTSEGYLTLSPSVSAGMTGLWNPRVLFEIPLSNSNPNQPRTSDSLIAGDWVYWKEGDAIKRLRLTGTWEAETFASVTGVESFKVYDGVVVIKKLVSANRYAYYKIENAGADPVLVDEREFGEETAIAFGF